jgi:hypothetical protein
MPGSTLLPHAATLVITTLAEYQTVFWIAVAQALRNAGVDVFICAFDDRSAEILAARGVPGARMASSAAALDATAFAAKMADYGIDNVNLLFSHERITFQIRHDASLRGKFLRDLAAVEAVLDRLTAEGRRPIMVQELGGFLSVIASFYAARRRALDSWFIEPSFFRGRLFFLRNAFHAYRVARPVATEVSPEVARYLEDTLARQAIVVPSKDRHQYRSALSKVVDWRNARRLVEKLYDKHVLGKRQEFEHIGTYVRLHLEMALNAIRMQSLYTPLEVAGPIIYYPLHVPADMALTLRSPEYLDQLALVDYVLRILPQTHRLAIKEHPAQVGAVSATRVRALLRRYDSLVVLPPSANNYKVLAAADAVISVNSKSGAEALAVGRPVLVLGDAFYADWEVVHRVDALRELAPLLRRALAQGRPDAQAVRRYFQNVWEQSAPGELYVQDPGNVNTFAQSLVGSISGCRRHNLTGTALPD